MHPCHVCIHVLCGDADTLRGRLDAAVCAAMLVFGLFCSCMHLFVYLSIYLCIHVMYVFTAVYAAMLVFGLYRPNTRGLDTYMHT